MGGVSCGGGSPPGPFTDPAGAPDVTFDLEWAPGDESGHPMVPGWHGSLSSELSPGQESAQPWTTVPTPDPQPAYPLLLPTGREPVTINQLLADEKMRKQNDYVEVRTKDGVGTCSKRQGPPQQWVPNCTVIQPSQ